MEKVAKWVVILALFAIPFLPLYVESSLYFPFISGKGFAFRILVEIAFGAWMLLFLSNTKYRPKFSWVGALFAALVVWAFIADLFAVNPYKAFWSNFERMDGWVTLIHVFMFFVVTSSMFSVRLWKNWWRTFLVGVALVCGTGALQLAGLLATNQGLRMDSTFGNPIYLANYMLFAIAITLWQALQSKQWVGRSLFLLLLAGEVATLFFTETRGAFIGIFVAAFVGAFWWVIESKKQSTKIVKQGAVGVLALLIVFGGLFFIARDSSFIQSNTTLHRLASIFSPEEFKVRFTIWDMAEKGALARPVFGWGQEGFNYVFNTYYNPFMYQQEVWFDRAHNTYLDWLVAGGVPAFLFFVAFLICLLWTITRSGLPKEERILLFCAVLAYGISALSVFDNLFTYIPLLAIAAYVHSRVGKPIALMEKLGTVTTLPLQAACALVLVLGTVTTIWIVNIPAISAGQTLIQAMQTQPGGVQYNLELFKRALAQKTFASQEIREQLIQYTTNVIRDPAVTSDTKVAFVQFAGNQMQLSLVDAPKDARLHSIMASLYAMIGDQKSAIGEIDVAFSLSPGKQTLLTQKGMILWQFNDVKGAQAAFHAAYMIDPSFKDLAAYDAAGDLQAGDATAAFALLNNVFGTTTVNNDALVHAYYQTGHFTELIAVERARVALTHSVNDRFSLALALGAAGDKTAALAELAALEKDQPETAAQVEQVRASIVTPTSSNP